MVESRNIQKFQIQKYINVQIYIHHPLILETIRNSQSWVFVNLGCLNRRTARHCPKAKTSGIFGKKLKIISNISENVLVG